MQSPRLKHGARKQGDSGRVGRTGDEDEEGIRFAEAPRKGLNLGGRSFRVCVRDVRTRPLLDHHEGRQTRLPPVTPSQFKGSMGFSTFGLRTCSRLPHAVLILASSHHTL